jgi:hypothetical protein
MAVLKNLKQEAELELARLREENAMLKRATSSSMKVSAKGGVSVYGLGRWPITLYRSQWESLLGQKESILAFIEANKASLATKGEADAD